MSVVFNDPPAPTQATHFSQLGEQLEEQAFYCPGCGRRSKYFRECNGPVNAPGHPPIDMVSTEELAGPAEGHTAAPPTA